jgi:V/A-type H+-transporting ATPase subunit A
MCSDAVERGCEDVLALFGIEARERIGRAKMVPQDEFNQAFNKIEADMKQQIEEVIAAGGDEQ